MAPPSNTHKIKILKISKYNNLLKPVSSSKTEKRARSDESEQSAEQPPALPRETERQQCATGQLTA